MTITSLLIWYSEKIMNKLTMFPLIKTEYNSSGKEFFYELTDIYWKKSQVNLILNEIQSGLYVIHRQSTTAASSTYLIGHHMLRLSCVYCIGRQKWSQTQCCITNFKDIFIWKVCILYSSIELKEIQEAGVCVEVQNLLHNIFPFFVLLAITNYHINVKLMTLFIT